MECVLLDDRAAGVEARIEEQHFQRLFKEVLDFLKDEHSIQDDDIGAAVDSIISSFRYDLGHKFSDVDLTRPDNVCGYLKRYAVPFAGLMRHKTLQAIRDCLVLKNRIKQPKLSVVSLGGGPGNDVVGFLSALHVLGLKGRRLHVAVIDTVEQWEQSVRLVKYFTRIGNFGSVSELRRDNTVDLMFLGSRLPCAMTDDVCQCLLEGADVILMCRLISILEWEEKTLLVDFLDHMLNESALILLVDCPFDRELWKNFDLLYLSDGGETYQLYDEPYPPVTSKSRIAVLRRK